MKSISCENPKEYSALFHNAGIFFKEYFDLLVFKNTVFTNVDYFIWQ
mgnify:CR=1 FL=1